MATRWAVQSGNWSDTTTWDGGTLPTSADDVFADGKTVTINQNVSVLSLRVTQRSGGTNGGTFLVTTQVSVTAATGFYCTNGVVATVTPPIGTTVTFTGTVNPPGYNGQAAIIFNGVGTFNVVGNVFGASSYYSHGILHSGSGQLNVTGNVQTVSSGTDNGNSDGIRVQSTGGFNVVGNISGANGSSLSAGLRVTSNANGTVTGVVNGNQSLAVRVDSSSSIININGSITGSGSNGVYSPGTALIRCTGPFISGTNGFSPIVAGKLQLINRTNTYWTFRDASSISGEPITLYSADISGGNPSASNVRLGTVYGPNNDVTGTLAVPPTDSVAAGVPVDNTFGTAAVRLADIAAVTGAQIAATLNV